MNTNKVVVFFAFLLAAGVGFAQGARGMGGGGISGQPIDGTTIKPKSVQASGTGDQFVCTNATAVCEVESSINATTMTSTVPAFDIGPTATPGTDDRLACFSYGPSGSKTRMMCVDKEGDINATTMALGTTPSGIRAHFLTEATAYTPTDFTSSHTVFGRSATSGAGSGGVWVTYHTTDNEGVIGSLSPVVAWRPLSFASSEWKFRQNGATLIANITGTGAFNSVAASGNQAFTCTNTGCRLSLGNTANYLFDNGSRLATSGALVVTGALRLGNVLQPDGASQLRMYGRVADGSGAVSIIVGPDVAFSTQGSKLFVVDNGASGEQLFVDHLGLLRVNASNAAKPTCNTTNRGKVFYLNGAAGVADTYEICMKNSSDVYAWKTIVTP